MSEVEKKKLTALSDSRGTWQSEVRPIVLEYKDRKKKKKRVIEDEDEEKYSKGLADVQQLEGNILRVTKRSTNALSKGIDTYQHERNLSAKEKKDGAIEDFVDNSAKAVSASLKEASEIPMDIAESLSTKSSRKRARKSLRRASRIIRLFRI
jgi:hypothetical protein